MNVHTHAHNTHTHISIGDAAHNASSVNPIQSKPGPDNWTEVLPFGTTNLEGNPCPVEHCVRCIASSGVVLLPRSGARLCYDRETVQILQSVRAGWR